MKIILILIIVISNLNFLYIYLVLNIVVKQFNQYFIITFFVYIFIIKLANNIAIMLNLKI